MSVGKAALNTLNRYQQWTAGNRERFHKDYPRLAPIVDKVVEGLTTAAMYEAGLGGAASGVKILEREGATIVGSFKVAGGEARFVGDLVRNGDDLILSGAHIEGDATLKEVLKAAKEFGKEQGAKRVIIEGGKRTTGANPGHVPRPITVETGL